MIQKIKSLIEKRINNLEIVKDSSESSQLTKNMLQICIDEDKAILRLIENKLEN